MIAAQYERVPERSAHDLSVGHSLEDPHPSFPDSRSTLLEPERKVHHRIDEDGNDDEDEIKENASTTGAAPNWKPFWLRRAVLGGFFCLFISLMVVLPAMLWYSIHSQGIADINDGLRYLWRFGPTACMSAIPSTSRKYII